MINQVYRLVSERQFEVANVDESLTSDVVVVRPTHLSICAADQRYYTGSRGKEMLSKKLPMALIHEGVGEVVYDATKEFKPGTKVVMIPNTPFEEDPVVAENYLRSSKFRSSGYDGLMQDYVFMRRDRVVALPDDINMKVAAFSELISVAVHAILRFEGKSNANRESFGVWGDGNLGFITSLLLKNWYPDSKVYIFGKTPYKLDFFSFVDGAYAIDDVPADLVIDQAFECAGGMGSQYAVSQIIDVIKPEGTISLLGVSEYPIEFNSRMVLEKGLTVYGSSRSGRVDFEKTVEFLSTNKRGVEYLQNLVGEVHTVHSIQDVIEAFEADLRSPWGKSVMEWKI
ncbi:alcohol dehydrogenase catalytic domain-containing protein [Listeria marthii]|uniref:Ribulose-5-phosphate reductase n=1 Tax=Listeria marthii FSL S4-120 TaxID=702457 RepID=A0ABN0BYF3_9LIST|nr:ribitol-5-phosphate dehydrogenase [Listeria marthii]EFR88128.1 putative ribitol-5-phosphate dehydrogenase [Listeria marthii FSL S4-120]MBC2038831.1 alcohol dehydrogenase catalytic domain-containing protein [Listeria marthii]MBC2061166.1 alcohol dehydrogenase catalytic domain-containing protein [Listeria marthii]MBC2072871.1 alcohol dehydrogenase catalytic domain-containing protein [Listeria marthii]MBC2076223.1 alcohol dehydrogenase catalytic domain-containing protein [Listeria marthii]